VSTNKTKNNACICGESSCGQLSRWFAALNDARGCKLAMPAIGGTNNPERKQFKVERCCHHLGLGKSNAAEYASIDNRKEAKKAAKLLFNCQKSLKCHHLYWPFHRHNWNHHSRLPSAWCQRTRTHHQIRIRRYYSPINRNKLCICFKRTLEHHAFLIGACTPENLRCNVLTWA